MISSDSISFCIQGPPVLSGGVETLDKAFPAVSGIRRFFPDAEIIVSTWTGPHTSSYVTAGDIKVILTDDPGSYDGVTEQWTRNFIRQVVSTSVGLQACTRKYAVKIRSDIFFESAKLLSVLKKNNALPIVWSRALPSSYLYFLPDWFLFDETSRLLDIFRFDSEILKIDLQYYKEFHYVGMNPFYHCSPFPAHSRFHAEQYLGRNLSRLKYGEDFVNLYTHHYQPVSLQTAFSIYRKFSQIFTPYTYFELGIESSKYPSRDSRPDVFFPWLLTVYRTGRVGILLVLFFNFAIKILTRAYRATVR